MAKRKHHRHSKLKLSHSDQPPVGELIEKYQECPLCGSSDAVAHYFREETEEYQSWCFSCKAIQVADSQEELYDLVEYKARIKENSKPKQKDTRVTTETRQTAKHNNKEVVLDFKYHDISDWKINKNVCEEVGMPTVLVETPDGWEREILANYKDDSGRIVAQKSREQTLKWRRDSAGDIERDADGKRLWETTSTGLPKWEYKKDSRGKETKCVWRGNVAEATLMGMDRAKRMSKKKLVITEGEKDLAAFCCFFDRIAVVSTKNGAQGVAADIKKHFQFFNEFDEIVVIGDNDDPGREMNRVVSEMFPKKAKVCHLDKFKDVHEYWENNAGEEFRSCFFNAQRLVPTMVKPISDLVPLLFEEAPPAYCSYPWESFNKLLGGIHGGEVVGLLGLEGTGKTTLLRNVAHHVWKTTGDPVGIVFLEDTPQELIEGIVSVHLGQNLRDPKIRESVDSGELREAAKELTQDDRIYFKAEGGPGEINDLMDVIDWMVAVGCKVIFFDNVSTLIVGDTMSDTERQGIDNLVAECRDRATANNITIFVVQHLNPNGQARGSRMINITASSIIEIRQEDTSDKDDVPEEAKNVSEFICRKNRRLGKKGKLGYLFYDHATSRLTEANQAAIISLIEWKEKIKQESKKRN